MRYFTRLPLTIAMFAALGLGGSAALAEPAPSPGQLDEIVLTDDPCEPTEENCGNPEPDPEVNPDLPAGPGVLTDDPCDPGEGPCGGSDPEPEPDPEPQPEPEPEPQPQPEPEPGLCELDDVCTRTPTFTG